MGFWRRGAREVQEARLAEELGDAALEEAGEPLAPPRAAIFDGPLAPLARWYETRLLRAGYAARALGPFLLAKLAALGAGGAAVAAVLAWRPLGRLGAPAFDVPFAAALGVLGLLAPEG